MFHHRTPSPLVPTQTHLTDENHNATFPGLPRPPLLNLSLTNNSIPNKSGPFQGSDEALDASQSPADRGDGASSFTAASEEFETCKEIQFSQGLLNMGWSWSFNGSSLGRISFVCVSGELQYPMMVRTAVNGDFPP